MRRALFLRQAQALAVQSRAKHESLIPAGAGGRSSFSGQAATVFGGTGWVGKSLVNNLGKIGSSVVVPIRGTVERWDALYLRMLADLGGIQQIPQFDMHRWSDERVAESIRYSNVVYNCIGSWKDTNNFSRRLTNVEWPERLARLVAAKGDGTRLVHFVHLNCEDPHLMKYCGILREQHEAINIMREIYPDTIVVKSSKLVGFKDMNFGTSWWALEGEWGLRTIQYIGAFPLMYGGGKNTFVAPVFKTDATRAMVKIGQHPDSDGHDFELFGDKRYQLSQLVEFMYDVKWGCIFDKRIRHRRSPGLHQTKDVDLDLFLWDVLGEMDISKKEMSPLQKFRRYVLHLHLAKLNWPRFHPLFWFRGFDYFKREQSLYKDWTNQDHFALMNMSDEPTFQNPGYKELGVKLTDPLQIIHESCANFNLQGPENYRPLHDFDHPPSHEWVQKEEFNPLRISH